MLLPRSINRAYGNCLLMLAGLLVLPGCANHTVAVWQENDSIKLLPKEFTNYSNGMQFTLSPTAPHSPCRPDCDTLLASVVDRLNVLEVEDDADAANIWLRYGIGHQFFTPDDVTIPELQPDDRPYAGWLFASLDIVNEVKRDQPEEGFTHYRNTVGLRAGIVGPSSHGDALQSWWHDVCTCDEPQGWKYQLRDEPGFMYSLGHERKLVHRRLPRAFSFDVIGSAGGTIGNVHYGVHVGSALRLGWRMDDGWAATMIDDVGYESGRVESGFGLSLIGALETRFVARDLFIDGNSWTDSHSVDRELLVTDQVVGLGLHRRRFELRVTFTRRSHQYQTQAEPVRFGSVAFVWRP